MKIRFLKIAAILLFSGPVASYADPVVFENAYDDQVTVAGPAWCSGCGTWWRVWDTFTLQADTEITQIDARLYLIGTQSVEYSIWKTDLSEILFSRVFTMSELSYNPFGGMMESDVTAQTDALSLVAGEYALSIWDMAARGSHFAWYSTTYKYSLDHRVEGSGYQSLFHDGYGPNGGGTGEDMAFRVHGITAVPEPGTIALLLLGLLGMSLTRRTPINTD